MVSTYTCKVKCFFRGGIAKVGDAIMADDSEMKGNSCFEKVEAKVEKKPVPKAVKETIQAVMKENK